MSSEAIDAVASRMRTAELRRTTCPHASRVQTRTGHRVAISEQHGSPAVRHTGMPVLILTRTTDQASHAVLRAPKTRRINNAQEVRRIHAARRRGIGAMHQSESTSSRPPPSFNANVAQR